MTKVTTALRKIVGHTQMYRCLGYLIKRNLLQEIDTAANKFNFRKLAPFSSVNFVLAFT